MPITPIEFIQARVRVVDTGYETPCWDCIMVPNAGGYCKCKWQGKTVYIHRLAYESCIGPVPPGKIVERKCFNKICANPGHLGLSTISEKNGRNFDQEYLIKFIKARIQVRDAGYLTPCWECVTAPNEAGYCKFNYQYRTWFAHRLAYTALVGPIPENLVLDHKCRNTICANPEHLQPVTRSEGNIVSFGPGAQQLAKDFCPQGHPYDEENTYRAPGSPDHRQCWACLMERSQQRRWEHHKEVNHHRLERGWKPFASTLDQIYELV